MHRFACKDLVSASQWQPPATSMTWRAQSGAHAYAQLSRQHSALRFAVARLIFQVLARPRRPLPRRLSWTSVPALPAVEAMYRYTHALQEQRLYCMNLHVFPRHKDQSMTVYHTHAWFNTQYHEANNVKGPGTDARRSRRLESDTWAECHSFVARDIHRS